MKIFLVRHGETTGDVEDRYGGSYDDHLTEKGRSQIGVTAKKLTGKGIDIIFVSPLIRTKETAEIIQSALRCPIKVIEDIKERYYGVLGGLTKSEAIERYPEAVEWHKDPLNTDLGGESYVYFNERVTKSFESITKQDYDTVAIVSHGGPIKSILRHLNEKIPDSIGDGGIIELDVDA